MTRIEIICAIDEKQQQIANERLQVARAIAALELELDNAADFRGDAGERLAGWEKRQQSLPRRQKRLEAEIAALQVQLQNQTK